MIAETIESLSTQLQIPPEEEKKQRPDSEPMKAQVDLEKISEKKTKTSISELNKKVLSPIKAKPT